MNLDKEIFKQHLESTPYEIGFNKGKWGVESNLEDWPAVIIWVKCSGYIGLKSKYHFRFILSNYPEQTPNATVWDVNNNCISKSEDWPTSDSLSEIFRPEWNVNGLYLPCDKIAIDTHPDWSNKYNNYKWCSDSTIVNYLDLLFNYLNIVSENENT